jgi:hypothetical protein
MLNRNEVEIFEQAHQMYAEGKHANSPSESDIVLLLYDEGYEASNINISYDKMMGVYNWYAEIEKVG